MSVTFGQCPHCVKGGRAVRLYGGGVCFHHFQHPPVEGEKPAVIKPTLAEVVDIIAGRPPSKKELDAWFEARYQERPRTCEEPGCDEKLPTRIKWMIKATIAHVVPKRLFHSVAIHPLNRVFLCKHHHDDYDSSWAKARTLGCWPLAVERFQVFMHLISDKELRFLPPALRELTNR